MEARFHNDLTASLVLFMQVHVEEVIANDIQGSTLGP